MGRSGRRAAPVQRWVTPPWTILLRFLFSLLADFSRCVFGNRSRTASYRVNFEAVADARGPRCIRGLLRKKFHHHVIL